MKFDEVPMCIRSRLNWAHKVWESLEQQKYHFLIGNHLDEVDRLEDVDIDDEVDSELE